MAKILIIDDRPLNRQFLSTLLGYQHHDLHEASDGSEGLRVAREERPDLIISDVLMPTMDGYEFVRRLREDPKIGKTPVVFSTAHYLSRESQALAEKSGVTSIIYKPCEPQTVLEIVAAALQPQAASAPAPPAPPDDLDRQHLQLLTNKLAEKTDQLREVHGKLTALIELSTELASERDPVELLNRYCSVAREVIGARWTLVALLQRERNTIQHLGVVGLDLEDTPALRSALLATGVFATLVNEARAICLSDVTSTPEALRLPDSLPRAASLLVSPLAMRGRVIGWICLADKLGLDAFSEQDEQLATALAAKMAVAYDNACLYTDSLKYTSKLEIEISERAKAERQLSESKARLSGIIDSAMDAIVTIDSDQRVVMFNEAAEKMFRCTATDALGKPLDRFIPPRFRPNHGKDIRKFGETGVSSRTMAAARAVSGLRADGEEFPMEASISQIEVAGQKLYTVIMRDISERKRAEEKIHETSETLQTFIRASPLAIVALDMERKVTLWNPAAERLFGWTESEAIGRVLPTISDEDLPDQLELRRQFLERGSPISNLETRRLRKDGSYVDVSASYAPLRDPQARIIGTVGIIADITERKNAEAARLKAAEQYRLLFESNPLPMWVFDRETLGFLAVNEATVEHYGFSLEEFLSMTVKDIRPPEDVARLLESLTDRQSGLERSGKWRHRKKDGTLIEVEIASYAADFNGRPAELVLANDVTDQVRAQQALRTKTEELANMTQQLWQASKLATMGELAASIAHELNNPLATVGLRTENLLMQMPADSDQRKPLEIIAQEVDRMATLVENLLQFSRRSHRQISTVDPREEIANSSEFVHYHLRNRKIEVVREFADSLPTIQADRQQLRQLFLNLLTNASDAMPKGGKLTVRASPAILNKAKAVAIEFVDTGEGITPENLEKIWEPFFTTKAEGKGTGLGLAICRRIVEEHGGTIDFQSEAGHGTTARIVLPATSNGSVVK